MKKGIVKFIGAAFVLTSLMFFAPQHFIAEQPIITQISILKHSGYTNETEELILDSFDILSAHVDLVDALREIICMRVVDIPSYSVHDADYLMRAYTQDGSYIVLYAGKDLNGHDLSVCWKYRHGFWHKYRILNYNEVEPLLIKATANIVSE